MDYNKRVFYGSAFNEAYLSESKKAFVPIIVVADSLVKYLQASVACSSFQILNLLQDIEHNNFNHSQTYLNYLLYMANCITHNSLERGKKFYETHNKVISKELLTQSKSVNVLSKYLWLKEYHDHYGVFF